MREINLTQGMVVMVDDEDFDYLNQWKWQCIKSLNTYYATRTKNVKEGKHTSVQMHRIIMDTPDDMQVDHIDHDGLNNQKTNLRNCTKHQNLFNTLPYGSGKYKGVNRLTQRRGDKVYITYVARIQVNHNPIYLGAFKTEEEAALAYDIAAIKYFGEFAHINFESDVYTSELSERSCG